MTNVTGDQQPLEKELGTANEAHSSFDSIDIGESRDFGPAGERFDEADAPAAAVARTDDSEF